MTALMGGDGTMEQQTEKDVRFENDPQAEVFLLSEKTKEKENKLDQTTGNQQENMISIE